MSAPRLFGALLAHDVVCLVEYRAESTGVRVVNQWANYERTTSIDDAVSRLVTLVSARGVRRPRIAIAIEQFGVFHHVMTLPRTPDDVIRPIVLRESQRLFGVTDPVIAFTRGAMHERRDKSRDHARSTPTQVFVAGAPRETVESLHIQLSAQDIDVEIATVVPKAIHGLYQASGASLEPTAVLTCLEGGPHLSFFLDGRLELAIDPPQALEGERAPIPIILDQVERGAVYFRQQFRGAAATRMLLAARPSEYAELSAALEERLTVRVDPLFSGTVAPEVVVAVGAVLESRNRKPLDLYPHPPTIADRVRGALRGPNAAVAGMAAAALVAGVWSSAQFVSLSAARRESSALRASLSAGAASLEPMRRIAEGRADYANAVGFVETSRAERAALTNVLRGVADQAPAGVRFDSLRVSRAASGWATTLVGELVAASGAQAVGGLDAFYQSIRAREGITMATLDDFDYPALSAADSSRRTAGPVLVQFRVSFAIARPTARSTGAAH